jgi:hypothetical protein
LGFVKHLPAEVIEQITSLISELTPTDLKNQLFLKVTKPEWDTYEKDDQGHYIDKPKINAEALAKKIIEESLPWTQYIQDLLGGEQRQAFNFGKQIADLMVEKERLLKIAIQSLKTIPKENQNPELIAGIISNPENKDLAKKIIDEFIHDDKLRQHAFYLTRVINTTYDDIEKLFVLVDTFGFPITQFQNFQYGKALDKLTNEEVILLCTKISKYGNSGKWTALSLVYMFCYSNEERWNQNREFFKSIISSGNMTIGNDGTNKIESYHWSDSVNKILAKGNEKEFAITITKQIIEFCSQRHLNYSFDTYLSSVIFVLIEEYFDTVWEYFGEGIIGEYMTFFHLESLIGTRNGYLGSRECVFFKNAQKYEIIMEWCRKNTGKAPERIAHMMPLDVNEKGEIKWHPFSKAFINEFGDNEKVLNQLSSNMGTFGTVGSSIPYFTTQKKLLEELINHNIPRVKNWAIKMLESTEKTIKKERLDDEERFLT